MGQILHGSACTTEVTRRAIQNSQESLKALSEKYGSNHKTMSKWRKREFVHDAPMGPKKTRSTILLTGRRSRLCGLSQIHAVAFG